MAIMPPPASRIAEPPSTQPARSLPIAAVTSSALPSDAGAMGRPAEPLSGDGEGRDEPAACSNGSDIAWQLNDPNPSIYRKDNGFLKAVRGGVRCRCATRGPEP